MHGITTILVAFVLIGTVFPSLIKDLQQFQAVIGVTLFIILLDCIGHFAPGTGLEKLMYAVIALLQITSIFMLVLCTRGQSMGEFADSMHKTIDLVRRGGEKDEIIVPLRGEQPKERNSRSGY